MSVAFGYDEFVMATSFSVRQLWQKIFGLEHWIQMTFSQRCSMLLSLLSDFEILKRAKKSLDFP